MSEKILKGLKDAVVDGDVQKAQKIAEQIVKQEISANGAVEVLMKAMEIVDERYERKEYFVIDVASSASAMREAFKLLVPYLKVEPAMIKGKIVIGSLKGNVQSLGKDIVAATLRSAGFNVVNLGVDVAPEEMVKAAIREKAQIIAISVSMEESIPYLKDIVDLLKKESLRDKIKIIIGGNAVSEQTRSDYELDAYAADAQECLHKVQSLLG
ncbi:MAG: B12-binding domain-containing protein [Candidatus Bathyarchaeia archaeon]